MSKRLLTLSDLYDFYVNNGKNVNFSAQTEDNTIVVQVPERLLFDAESDYDANELKAIGHFQFCHIDENANHTSIAREVMEQAIPSAYNIPILAYIYMNEDGEWDFAGHEIDYDEDDNPIYYETPVGTVPESGDLKLEYDEDKQKTYLTGDGIIWKYYSKATDILKRYVDSQGYCNVSVELNLDEIAFNASKKILEIKKFHFSGVTLLGTKIGTNKIIKPGMTGANVTFSDFSQTKNRLSQLLGEVQKLNRNIETMSLATKGAKVNFAELCKKYGVSAKDITFDYENLSEDELVQKFEATFGAAANTPEPNEGAATTPENPDQGDTPADPEGEATPDTGAALADPEPTEPTGDPTPVGYAVKMSDGSIKEYSLSLDDVYSALSNLVNTTYGETDNTWYSVDIYPDDNRVVMQSYCNGTAYRQEYSRVDDSFALVGERVPVHRVWVTKEEETSLNEMKANYASISDKLATYEQKEEAEKKEKILTEEVYSSIADTEAFKEILEHKATYSADEIAEKCDALLLQKVKSSMNFAHKAENSRGVTPLPGYNANDESAHDRYGGIFDD